MRAVASRRPSAWPKRGPRDRVGYGRPRDSGPAITIRGSYLTRKGYVVNFWDDQVLGSIVFVNKVK